MQSTTDTDSVSARLDEGRVGTRNSTGVIELSSLRSRREYQPDKYMKIIDNIRNEGFAHKVDTREMGKRERILPTTPKVDLEFSIASTVDVRRFFVLNILH